MHVYQYTYNHSLNILPILIYLCIFNQCYNAFNATILQDAIDKCVRIIDLYIINY